MNYDSKGTNPCTDNPLRYHYNVDETKSPFYEHTNVNTGQTFIVRGNKKVRFVKRRPCVPRVYWPSFEASNLEAREDYFRRLIMLFLPWFDEAQLMGKFDSYNDRWNDYVANLQKSDPFAAEDLLKYIDNITKQLETENELYEKRRKQREIAELEEVEMEDQEAALEVFNRQINLEEHEKGLNNLNAGQKEIFDFVIQTIADQVFILT